MRDRAVPALLLINIVTLTMLALLAGAPQAAPATGVLRAQLIELVDARGVTRASLKTEGEGVVFRLMDERGRIRVKLGAGEESSGLLLADETSEVGIHLLAGLSALTGQRDTKLVLAEPGGRNTTIHPGDAAR
jgi:hypothetical protein